MSVTLPATYTNAGNNPTKGKIPQANGLPTDLQHIWK